MNRLLFGAALGALAMYFWDPHSGRRRRARTRDKLVRAGKVLNHAGRVTARNTLMAGTRSMNVTSVCQLLAFE